MSDDQVKEIGILSFDGACESPPPTPYRGCRTGYRRPFGLDGTWDSPPSSRYRGRHTLPFGLDGAYDQLEDGLQTGDGEVTDNNVMRRLIAVSAEGH